MPITNQGEVGVWTGLESGRCSCDFFEKGHENKSFGIETLLLFVNFFFEDMVRRVSLQVFLERV
jgi:hypothetical protein